MHEDSLEQIVNYLTSVGDQPLHSSETNVLLFHPIVSLRPLDGLTISLWREHPIILDTATNRWFVPFDAMASYAIIPHLSLSVGVAVPLGGSNRVYDSIVYGRVAFSF